MKILSVDKAETIVKLAVRRLADYVKDSQLKCLVLGISGGLDSAVMAAIGLRATTLLHSEGYLCQYYFVYIDIQSHQTDLQKAQELAKCLNFNLAREDLTHWYLQCGFRINNPVFFEDRVKNGNIKCRLRMIYLYSEAGSRRGVVLDTDDLSEYLMGFFTKHGDVGDVKILQNLTKDEVRDLAEYLKVTQSIISSAPGDGLGVTVNNQAKDQLKMEYLKTDYVISRAIYHGLSINGKIEQLERLELRKNIDVFAKEINESVENVLHVIRQSLKTKFKRVGDEAVILLPSRTEMGLPELGTYAFERTYLKAIQSL
jgi:NAD+ synthase